MPTKMTEPLPAVKDALIRLVKGVVLAQGNVFIKELLRPRGIRIGTTKADFEANMIEAIQSGELQRHHVDSWLREVEGWGNQHVYLFNVSKSLREDAIWNNPKQIESKLKTAGFTKQWNSRSSLEYPSAQTLTSVYFENGALTLEWHKGLDLWVRAKTKDYKQEDEGDIFEYRAYRMRGDRIVTRFELRPSDGLAAIFVQIAVDDEEHKAALETVKKNVERCWPFDEFTPFSIANAIKKLDSEALKSESITTQSTRLNSGGAYVEFGASSAQSGYLDSTPVRDVRRSVRQGSFTGTNGRFLVPISGGAEPERKVRLQMFGKERRIKIASQMTAEQVCSRRHNELSIMTPPPIEWGALLEEHSPELIKVARGLFSAGGPFQISAAEMAAETSRSAMEAERLLVALCPPLRRAWCSCCPICETELSDDERLVERCPNCDQPFSENGGVRQICQFQYTAPRSRDVIWALALHGMNTRGEWQEDLNWRMSTAYGRSVPVAIYKYGFVRPGALWRPSLRRLRDEVAAKIAALHGDALEGGFLGPPDVIAHSLGTWLIGHALQRHSSLRIGRLILTGSILRPDFDWDSLIAKGQVEAVLNHYGSEDFWAGIAHFLIPDSGPSGRRGFNSAINVTQVCAQGYGHSDFFLRDNLALVFEEAWRPFLTRELGIQLAASAEAKDWNPTIWPLRATILPILLLAVYWGVICILVFACLVGLHGALR